MAEEKTLPLKNLHQKRLDTYTLYLGELRQLRKTGWRRFELFLQERGGIISELPVITGIYSMGGKDDVKPWMDVDYCDEIKFLGSKRGKKSFSLSSVGLDKGLFKYLGSIIPPGGHLMVSYEGVQKIQRETKKSLNIGIPPAATALGFLIFQSGFHYIKDWYLAEGGMEGPRKLWGEKALDDVWAKTLYKKTVHQILEFLEKEHNNELEKSAIKRSQEILEVINKIH